jgi:hypothetical protein
VPSETGQQTLLQHSQIRILPIVDEDAATVNVPSKTKKGISESF